MLLEAVRDIVPVELGVTAGLRLWPARRAQPGDVCTDAALVLARRAGRPARSLAEALASRLGDVPGVALARMAGAGFVNIWFADAALEGLLPRLLLRRQGATGPALAPLVVPLAGMTLDDPSFRIQYAHARCRSVQRAAAADPAAGWSSKLERMRGMARIGPLPPGPRRALVCALEHGACPGGDTALAGDALRRWLDRLAAAFECVWNDSAGHATLRDVMVRFLDPARPDATLVDLALVMATADAIRDGLAQLGLRAAEEIR